MNGTLTSGSHNASGRVVTLASSNETPVTPASMKLLERRNPFKPNAAAPMPAAISSRFSSSRRNGDMSPIFLCALCGFFSVALLLRDDAAGDAIAGVAGRIGLEIVDAGVHHQRPVHAHLHVRCDDRRLRRAVL